MPNAMNGDLLNRAYEVAYFIHADHQVAIEVATEAMSKLEVATTAQDKRLYYTPRLRTVRTKVSHSERHLLQRLTYIESESHERKTELDGRGMNRADFIIRFIKHLVRITIKRNSFYVTVGLSRLLHSYSTSEAMEIQNVVVQDPERVRDDYYYRSRKKRLMFELKERFGDALNVLRANRGEERFETYDCSARDADLVRECLQKFTPWDTRCVVPDIFDPIGETIAQLCSRGSDPEEENKVEMNRIHSILDPECFRRLIRALGFASPADRLSVPKMINSNSDEDETGSRGDRRRGPGLSTQDSDRIELSLGEQAARRRSLSSGLLSVAVDGVESGVIDLDRTNIVRLEIDEHAEMLEVIGHDKQGSLLLATHLVSGNESTGGRDLRHSIVLEGGQRITLTLSRQSSNGPALIEVAYHETRPLRAAALSVRQLRARTAGWSGARAWKPALAFAVLLLLAVSAVVVVRSVRRPEARQAVNGGQPDSGSKHEKSEPPPSTIDEPSEKGSGTPNVSRAPLVAGSKHPETLKRSQNNASHVAAVPESRDESQSDAGASEATRSVVPPATGLRLGEVKLVSVEPIGDSHLSGQVRDLLIAQIQAGKRLAVTPNRDEADAVLKISVRQLSPGNASIIARLVNAAGYVIWPPTAGGSGAKYTGSITEATSRIAADVLGEIERLERKQ